MGTTRLGLTIPDLPLGDIGSTKVTTSIVNGGTEKPRSLERWSRTGRALGRDEAIKKGSGEKGGEGTHLYWDWWLETRLMARKGSTVVGLLVNKAHSPS